MKENIAYQSEGKCHKANKLKSFQTLKFEIIDKRLKPKIMNEITHFQHD